MRINFYPFIFYDDNEALAQAFTRINIAVLTLILLFAFSYFNGFATPRDELLAYLLAAFYIAATAFYFYRVRDPARNDFTWLRLIFIFLDVTAVTLLFHLIGRYGPILFPAYLWIILGNGIRFGDRYLYIALSASLGAFAFLALSHPLLVASWPFSVGWLLAIGIIPAAFMVLVQKLKDARDELHETLKQVKYRSEHDPLTDMPNRILFNRTLETQMNSDTQERFALIFIDLDGFKEVNDTHGHNAGDAVLREVAERIRTCCDGKHFHARLGGDEFVVIYNQEHQQVPNFCGVLLDTLRTPYLDAKIDTISASVGISIFPHDADDEYLLKKYADMAMYTAKHRGKNQCAFYRDILSRDGVDFHI